MKTVTGVFLSRSDAERAAERLRSMGIGYDRMNLLTPGVTGRQMDALPSTPGEQPGMGKAMGGVVGGAIGAAGGMHLAMVAASILMPGVGPVIAIGLAAAALAGAGGAAGGAAAGEALEQSLTEGLPKDELFVYEDALRQGRTVLIVAAADDTQADAARVALADAGAETLDAARASWWIGLRSAERERYTAQGRDFDQAEPSYRLGFQAAMHPSSRGRTYAEAREVLPPRYVEIYSDEAFRHGYERGREYLESLMTRYPHAA